MGASNCANCPQGNGAAWCNGDCTWKNNQCVKKPKKECGNGKSADKCAQCPSAHVRVLTVLGTLTHHFVEILSRTMSELQVFTWFILLQFLMLLGGSNELNQQHL